MKLSTGWNRVEDVKQAHERIERDLIAILSRLKSGTSIGQIVAEYGCKRHVRQLYAANVSAAERMAARSKAISAVKGHDESERRVIADKRKIIARLMAGESVRSVESDYGQARLIERIYAANVPAGLRNELRKKKIRASNAAKGCLFRPGDRIRAVPMGMISRQKYRKTFRRWIKVDDRGPVSGQWMLFAQFVWLISENRPHIPRGCRVVHADGDSENDDPANLTLIKDADALMFISRIVPGAEAKRLRNMQRAKLDQASIRREAKQIVATLIECAACGYEPAGKIPERCPKCGASAWQKVRRPVKQTGAPWTATAKTKAA